MKLFIVAVDEPIYLNPYVEAIIDRRPADVVGVAVLRSAARGRSWQRTAALALLSRLVLSPRNRRRLAVLKARELAARVLPIRTRHTLADICRERGVPVESIRSACDPAFARSLRDRAVDVVLNQTSEILRGEILGAAPMGVINRHMALLPSYRGAWPVFWQFANGESRLGVTVHRVDAGIDTGEIIVQEAIERLPGDTIASAYERLFDRSVDLTCEALRRLRDAAPLKPNAGPGASYYPMPRVGDVWRFMRGRPIARLPRAA